ncbi:MAG: glutaredoxin family protein [candidate division NC10 bacterium]|nr:glutaredoxin family protein [candidate division NC10 bacterium]
MTFVDKNIREDPAALEELQQMGYRATPVTVIDGEAVVGFDRGKLMRLLDLS